MRASSRSPGGSQPDPLPALPAQRQLPECRVTSGFRLPPPARAADPAGAAGAALDRLPAGPLAVHIDVDVLDFTDAPLAEDTGGCNTAPTLGKAEQALTLAARDPRVRALSIGELNPTRSAGDPDAIPRFADSIARTLAATSRL